MSAQEIAELQEIAHRLRIDSINSTDASKSGHPTSCASAAEVMSVLFFHTMKYKLNEPRHPANDRFILSKGHAAPILYSAWAEAGLFPISELQNLRKFDSDLEGHPTPRLNFVDVATGSLGQGLSVAAGMAWIGKNVDKADYRTFCMMGDGESAEGSIWEAMSFAGHYKLDNLVAIFDINRLGQSEPTAFQHDLELYKKRAESFGFHAIIVDGHDIGAIIKALKEAEQTKGKPTALVCKTFKGKHFVGIEDKDDWHGKALGEAGKKVLADLTSRLTKKNTADYTVKHSEKVGPVPTCNLSNICLSEAPAYKLGEEVATRLAYGTALAKVGRNNCRVVALDGDTKNSTYADKFRKEFPDRFIECFIAEQNMVGVAIGAGCRGRTVPFCSTFAAFFTRAFDQLRMGAISQANIKCVGSHAGISIGEDGPSQMALEDLAMFRTIPNAVVFYPSDAVSCERAVELAANYNGIVFIRTSRPNTPVLYANDEPFAIGKSKVVKQSANDRVLLIGAGVTLHEANKAACQLATEGINARVLDIFTLKPIDSQSILENAVAAGGKVITVEDHYPEGGLGDAVAAVVATRKDLVLHKLAVTGMPRSGPPNVLLDAFGISSKHIVAAAKNIINQA